MEATENKMCHATQKIQDGVEELRDAVVKTSADAVEKCCHETEAYIREKPINMTLIAFGAGTLMAMFLLRC